MGSEHKGQNGAARLVSKLLHPWVLFAPVVAVAAYKAAGETAEWAKWTLLTLILVYAFPSLYTVLRSPSLRRAQGGGTAMRSLFRERPKELLIVTCLFGIPAVLVLHLLDEPRTVLATVIAVTAVMFVVGLLNLT